MEISMSIINKYTISILYMLVDLGHFDDNSLIFYVFPRICFFFLLTLKWIKIHLPFIR